MLENIMSTVFGTCFGMRHVKFNTLRPRLVLPLLIVLLTLVPVRPVYAYLDPASASAVIHGLISVLAASVVALRLYWARLKAFVRWVRGKAAGSPADLGIQEKSDLRSPKEKRTH